MVQSPVSRRGMFRKQSQWQPVYRSDLMMSGEYNLLLRTCWWGEAKVLPYSQSHSRTLYCKGALYMKRSRLHFNWLSLHYAEVHLNDQDAVLIMVNPTTYIIIVPLRLSNKK